MHRDILKLMEFVINIQISHSRVGSHPNTITGVSNIYNTFVKRYIGFFHAVQKVTELSVIYRSFFRTEIYISFINGICKNHGDIFVTQITLSVEIFNAFGFQHKDMSGFGDSIDVSRRC